MENDDYYLEIYQNRICKYCKYKDSCTQSRFTISRFIDKTSIRCSYYEYVNQEN